MASLNKVMLIGNLTRDPEVRYTPKGTAVTDIGLAVNRYIADDNERREETTFIDVTLWGKQAELAGQYLSKGRPVYIEGRLQMDQWQDKNTGENRSKLKVVGENMQFLGSRDGQSGGGGGGNYQGGGGGGGYQQSGPPQGGGGGGSQSSPPAGGPPPQQAPASSPAPSSGGGGDFAEEDDDIPF